MVKAKLAIAAKSKQGMVSTASVEATRAGVQMLEAGGNAIDAAVAAAFCLGVTEPQASGLGGQSMALLYLSDSKRALALDGSSRAPFAIDPMNLPPKPSSLGLKASTVPSTPATLSYLLKRYGSMSLKDVLQPAMAAAENGFRVTALQHKLLQREKTKLIKDPLIARRFFKDERPIPAGEKLFQPELAKCLNNLTEFGWQDFYQGSIARSILLDMQARGGLLSEADLFQIPIPRERPVLEGKYRQFGLMTFPPPGAGRALVEILNILENFELNADAIEHPETCVLLAHVFMNALRDRDRRPVDPDLYLQTPKRRMENKKHAKKLAERIRMLIPKSIVSKNDSSPLKGETTHLCACDADGNVVGITQSIELVFGAKRANPDYGFFYNNYMNTFEYKDMSHPYYLCPGSAPWSSVAPTILLRRSKPYLTLGSPGSERISTSLAQVILRIVDAGQLLEKAIAAPRLHSSMSGTIQIEAKRFNDKVHQALNTSGFQITRRGAYSFYLGCVQAIQIPNRKRDDFIGVADPRRDGSAMGPTSE
jgi:gamma-glutamyltranspeptidase/glutathione hydrolase